MNRIQNEFIGCMTAVRIDNEKDFNDFIDWASHLNVSILHPSILAGTIVPFSNSGIVTSFLTVAASSITLLSISNSLKSYCCRGCCSV